MDVNAINSTAGSSAADRRIGDAMSGQDFLELLVAELGNQDPLEPMDNQQLLSQLSEIRSLESSMKLSENLENLVMHSQMANSAGLIGKYIVGKDELGFDVEGIVESVRVESGKVMLQMGSHKIPFDGITQVKNPGTPAEATAS